MRPEDLLGATSPMVHIFQCLRSLSYNLDPDNIVRLDGMGASNTIYDTEFTLASMNDENVFEDELTTSEFSLETVPLRATAYLFLYLVIRDLPSSSPLLLLIVERIQSGIELQQEWWKATYERKVWLLWMLFMGGAAAAGNNLRWWYVHELTNMCKEMGISEKCKFKGFLKMVLWQDAWCEDHCLNLWDDLQTLNSARISTLDPKLLMIHYNGQGG